MLWGRAEGKKSEEEDFCKKLQISIQNPLPSAVLNQSHCQPVTSIAEGGREDQGCVQSKGKLARSVMTQGLRVLEAQADAVMWEKVLAKLLLFCPFSVGLLCCFFF